MPSDPKECHANAVRCAELAAESKDPRLRETLRYLARQWTALAVKLETSRPLSDRIGAELPSRR
jgi:hypothetical protein